MSAWQAIFLIVPHAKADALIHATAKRDGEPSSDEPVDVDCWTDDQPPPSFFRRLDELLDRNNDRGEDLTWGREEGTRIDVLREDTRVVEISVRFDMRERNERFARGMANVAREFGYLFYSLERVLIGATPEALGTALAESSAAIFVEDPQRWLRNLPIR